MTSAVINPQTNTLRYRTYLLVLKVALFAYGVDFGFGLFLGASQLELMLWGVMMTALFGLHLHMRTTKVLSRLGEVTCYWVITLEALFEFALGLMARPEIIHTLLNVGVWLFVLYVFAFFVFEPKGGVYVASAVFLSSCVLSLGIVLGRGQLTSPVLYMLVKYYCANVFVIIFGYAAALWREQYERMRLNAETAEQLAFTDALTNVYNRRALESLLEKEAVRSERYARDFSIILFDLDNFKTINDSYGHAVGDEVLKKVADIVQDKLRKGDEVGRWGGEEFMVVCPETDVGQACMVAERLREALEAGPWKTVAVTASFGIAHKQDGELLGSLYERADKALYAAKRGGKNCVKVANIAGALTIEEALMG
jgi:diguanylate cyclase (GGDEF)-like protein